MGFARSVSLGNYISQHGLTTAMQHLYDSSYCIQYMSHTNNNIHKYQLQINLLSCIIITMYCLFRKSSYNIFFEIKIIYKGW